MMRDEVVEVTTEVELTDENLEVVVGGIQKGGTGGGFAQGSGSKIASGFGGGGGGGFGGGRVAKFAQGSRFG